MGNTADGEALLAERRAAENELKALDPHRYEIIEQWLDEELYGGLYGHGGMHRLPIVHLPAIRRLLRARAGVYRGRKSGAVTCDGNSKYDSEVGNERMAQAIDACLVALGTASALPPAASWDEFWPKW